MKTSFAFACVCLVAVSSAAVKFNVYQGEKLLGQARWTRNLLPNGEIHTEMAIYLKQPGRNVTVRQVANYDAGGSPIRTILETRRDSPSARSQVLADFKARTVQVVEDLDGNRKTRQVEIPTGSLADRSMLWFVRDHPKPGSKFAYQKLDMNTLQWVEWQTTYLGKNTKGHAVKSIAGKRSVEMVVDTNGDPIEINDSTGFRFVRFE